MLDLQLPVKKENKDMPSLNHSYICSRILRQLFNYSDLEALTELTLNIGSGLTPDICVYPADKINPNFSRDITKMQEMPVLAIEVVSASQNIQEILEKAEKLIDAGVKAVWTVEPYTRSVFVTTGDGEKIFYNQTVESEGIKVDFKQIFLKGSVS